MPIATPAHTPASAPDAAPTQSDEFPRVAVTGSHGLIGTALVESLERDGYQVRRVVRSRSAATGDDIFWDPTGGELDASALEGLDAVVHLAGENVAGIWTDEKKRRIRDSRVQGTRLLAERVAELRASPRVLVSASAVGYYGNRGNAVLDESSPPGDDFLAEVVQGWEAAAAPAAAAGVRVVNLRFGIVLSAEGGALKLMLPPFKLGLGGKVGDGRQWISWIALEDAVRAIRFAMDHEDLRGPINAVASRPVTNAEFVQTLGDVLGRPTLFSVPAAMLRLALGEEMAETTVLASQKVLPRGLQAAGFDFRHPGLEGALRAEVG